MPSADLPIFLRLIQDMFPFHHHLPTKFDDDLQKLATQAALEAKLQTDNGFIHKVVQLQELLDVRHSVMLLGPAGCAKTSIWRMLAASHNLGKAKKVCITEIVEPKAVPLPELYGYMTLAKEWKDGVVSIISEPLQRCASVVMVMSMFPLTCSAWYEQELQGARLLGVPDAQVDRVRWRHRYPLD